MVSTEVFQQEMEGITMVMMTQMAEFVEEDIISEHLRETHEIEVEIDIVPG